MTTSGNDDGDNNKNNDDHCLETKSCKVMAKFLGHPSMEKTQKIYNKKIVEVAGYIDIILSTISNNNNNDEDVNNNNNIIKCEMEHLFR